ncbi:MAG: hypothetical protein ACFFEN_11220 [Candidatus Thorarchaeota archaeon]
MTEVSENEFLNKLLDVVYKLSSIANQQSYRFRTKWEYLNPINDKPYVIRQLQLDKNKFLTDIDYRIQMLQNLEQAIVDGLNTIKSILITLYEKYFNSELFKNDFSDEDQKILRYLVAKEILGNLIQYNKIDHESVPIKYNLLARNYTIMRLNGITDDEILLNLKKLNIEDIEIADIHNLMDEIEEDGIIHVIKQDNQYLYEINRPIELSPEGKQHYSRFLAPIVDWPTGFWRSFYNVRELNVTPRENVRYRDFLVTTLSKTAIQGYTPAHYVFKNLIKYYEMIKDETT